MEAAIQNELFELMVHSRKDPAIRLIERFADQYGYEAAVIQLLEPALTRFSRVWSSQKNVSLAQGYIAARIAEEVLKNAAESRPEGSGDMKGPVVIGNIEDDYHALGRKLVTTFLRAYGWRVVDMGNDVLAEELVDRARAEKARVIGVSAMMYTTALNIKKVRIILDEQDLTDQIKLAVGGAVFVLRPKLAHEVGGDGTAKNALGAPDLIQSLWNAAAGSWGHDEEQ